MDTTTNSVLKINKIHSGPRGWTKKLLEVHGEQAVYDYWYLNGNRKTAEHFGVTPWVISYCVDKFNWTRPMEKAPHILMGVARGKLHPFDYKHLEFPKIIIYPVFATNAAIQKQAYLMRKAETFIGWCIQHTQDHSECRKIYGWIRGDQHLDGAESAEELKKAMQKHPEKWFHSEYYNLIDRIHDVYTNEET